MGSRFSKGQYLVLNAMINILDPARPQKYTEIAQAAGIHPSYVSELIERLKEKIQIKSGLIDIDNNPCCDVNGKGKILYRAYKIPISKIPYGKELLNTFKNDKSN